MSDGTDGTDWADPMMDDGAFEDIACECGHGSTEHTAALIGYACTRCTCQLLRSRPGARVTVAADNRQDET